ncbi:MAG TPA: hypothetical protein VKY19_16195 [Ktedonosporobacter sp.]|jgi:hypothetical protein|nr:hypothetical protein [Ktedonosporobacter sp.]
MSEKLIVLDPTLEVEAPQTKQAARPSQIRMLGLLDNSKPNSGELLKKVAVLLAERYPEVQVRYYRKSGAYRPAPAALLDQMAAECDAALVGIGD